MQNLPIKLTGYTPRERNNKVAEYIRRGYKILDRGKHHANFIPTNRVIYWATVVKDDEQS